MSCSINKVTACLIPAIDVFLFSSLQIRIFGGYRLLWKSFDNLGFQVLFPKCNRITYHIGQLLSMDTTVIVVVEVMVVSSFSLNDL